MSSTFYGTIEEVRISGEWFLCRMKSGNTDEVRLDLLFNKKLTNQHGLGESDVKKGLRLQLSYVEKDGRYFASEIKNIYSNNPNKRKPQSKSTFNETGMHVGHAMKGAFTLASRFEIDLNKAGELVHDLTRKYQALLEEQGQSPRDSGMAAGCAVLCACQTCKDPTVESISTEVDIALESFTKHMLDYLSK